jgi:hypothetical protein
VTFGTTEDTTFASNSTDASMAELAIAADLNSGGFITAGGGCFEGVDGGLDTFYGSSSGNLACSPSGVSGWSVVIPPILSASYAVDLSLNGPLFVWVEFTPATVTTPEPSTFGLMLVGTGLLALMPVMRKRIARGLPQAA